MTTLKIDIPDEAVLARLQDRADEHNRSISEEASEIIRAAVRPSRDDRLARARRISDMTPKGVKQTDSVELLREDRSR
jgi:plasmid stability protein